MAKNTKVVTKMVRENRFRSPALWVAIGAQLLIILKIFRVLDMIGLPENDLVTAATAFLQLLVLAGILNDPTNPNSF